MMNMPKHEMIVDIGRAEAWVVGPLEKNGRT